MKGWEELETPTGSYLIDWAEEYLNFAKVKFTVKVYDEKRFIFKRFFKVVDPEMPAPEMRPRLALSYLQKQVEERSGYAANKERKNLLAAWNWGIKYMALPAPNPFLVDKFPEQRHNRYIPSEDDFWKVYDVAEGQDKVMLLAYLQLAARRVGALPSPIGRMSILPKAKSDLPPGKGRAAVWKKTGYPCWMSCISLF